MMSQRPRNALKLLHALEQRHKVSTDWEGTRCCGSTFDWHCDQGCVDVSMPGHVERALQRFEHPTPSRLQHAPHPWDAPVCGAKTQLAPAPDTSDTLSNGERQRTQQTLGTFLFHARAVDMCMLQAIGSIATKQAQPTVGTMNKITWLLNYAATWNAADFHGMPRTSMEFRESPWNSTDFRESP